VVVDSRLRLDLTSKLVRTAAQVPTWVACLADPEPDRAQAFRDAGVELLEIAPGQDGEMPIRAVLAALAGRGVTRVLAEGGARLAASLMRDNLADRIEWFRAASIIGGDGIPALQGFGLEHLAGAPTFERLSVRQCGADVVESYRLMPRP
jgi:diaminohydroxyphosphoribosylaminopyrimidine deaminase/5-amino-6-(5-phosphoribosylamino)uracil reductase